MNKRSQIPIGASIHDANNIARKNAPFIVTNRPAVLAPTAAAQVPTFIPAATSAASGVSISNQNPSNVSAAGVASPGTVGEAADIGHVHPLSDLPASKITTGQLALARGGTNGDLSATGGAGQYVKQSGVGSAFTVGTIPATDLPGLSVTIVTAKLTVGGTNGSMTFVGGVLTASTPAT